MKQDKIGRTASNCWTFPFIPTTSTKIPIHNHYGTGSPFSVQVDELTIEEELKVGMEGDDDTTSDPVQEIRNAQNIRL